MQLLNQEQLDIPEENQESLLSNKIKAFNQKVKDHHCLTALYLLDDDVIMRKIQKNYSNGKMETKRTSQNSGDCLQKIEKTPNTVTKKKYKTKEDLSYFSRKIDKFKLFQVHEGEVGRRKAITPLEEQNLQNFTGNGILILNNGRKYEGSWEDGVLVNTAKISYTNGEIYIGQTYEYKKHGWGKLIFTNHDYYEGEFNFGDIHGQGKYYNSKGKMKASGEWKRGQLTH